MVDNTRHEDIDAQETEEWRDALTSLLEREGEVRAHYLIEELIDLGQALERTKGANQGQADSDNQPRSLIGGISDD